MTDLFAVSAPKIFDSETWHSNSALLIRDGRVLGIVPDDNVPTTAEVLHLPGTVVPGFVDLQVNGGGGILFNNQPDVSAVRTICRAHAQYGTTALLPTLITDTVQVTTAALAAGIEATRLHVPGFLGLHLEGPHLAVARKGTHDPDLIRAMTSEDLNRLVDAKPSLPVLMVTVAAETVGTEQIAALSQAGVVVSIGHSDAGEKTTTAAFEAGARQVTHLFNAMSQLQNREPGVVGAVLNAKAVSAGLIADGIHVHPAVIRVALAAKTGPGRIFLVTDSMSQTGSDLTSFVLNGRTVYRANGALRLANGTLAGADLDMIDAVRFMRDEVGVAWEEALRMASLYPAQSISVDGIHGHLREGALANFVQLDGQDTVVGTWIEGEVVFSRFPVPGKSQASRLAV